MAAASEEAVEFVRHPKFGWGRLIGSDGNYAEIMFVTEGRKRFIRDFAYGLQGPDKPAGSDIEELAKLCDGLVYLAPGEPPPKKTRKTTKRTTKKAAKKPAKKAAKKAAKKPAKKAAKKPAKKAAKKAKKK